MVIDFGSPSAEAYLRQGWSVREYGFTWTVGTKSIVEFAPGRCEEDVVVGIELEPAVHMVLCPTQTLTIIVNGILIATFVFSRQERKQLQVLVPGDVFRAREIVQLEFEHPDHLRPCDADASCLDSRCLSFMFFEVRFQPLTAERCKLSRDLQASIEAPLASASSAVHVADSFSESLMKFESLGLNCEFGFVQRHFGIEPISLLRFTGMPFRKLLYGLRHNFDDLAAVGNLSLFTPADNTSQGYIGKEIYYEMMYHASFNTTSIEIASLIPKEAKRLQFLARKLLEDINLSEKIFVMRAENLTENQVLDLYEIVHASGKGWLLWVVLDADLAGRVDLLLPGLMRGYMDRFAALELGLAEISYNVWRQLIENACAIWQEHN